MFEQLLNSFRRSVEALPPAEAETLFQRGAAHFKAGDYSHARDFWQRAAERGHVGARFNLGWLYQSGVGVAPDLNRARHCYEQAAEAGSSEALFQLGLLYHDGAGVERDYDRARQCWERAAALGNGDALFNLGLLYENGDGVVVDWDRARDYWERGAALGHAGARARVKEPWREGAVDMDLARARSQPRP